MSTRAILARLLPLTLAGGVAIYFVGIYELVPRWVLALGVGGLVLIMGIFTSRLLSPRRE
jgi:hypothetical protein